MKAKFATIARDVGMAVVIIIFFVLATGAIMNNANAASGKKLFKKCTACHSIQKGKNKVGPSLYDLFGRTSGTMKGYRYSKAMKKKQVIWTTNMLTLWIRDPKDLIPGTKMRKVRIKEKDIGPLIEFLFEERK